MVEVVDVVQHKQQQQMDDGDAVCEVGGNWVLVGLKCRSCSKVLSLSYHVFPSSTSIP